MFGDHRPLTRTGMLLFLACLFFLVGVLNSLVKVSWPYMFGVLLGFIVLTVVREKTGATMVWQKNAYSRRKSSLFLAIGIVIALLGLIAMLVVGMEFIFGFLAAMAISIGVFLAIGALLVLID